jgi:FkbM family methyltransferase
MLKCFSSFMAPFLCFVQLYSVPPYQEFFYPPQYTEHCYLNNVKGINKKDIRLVFELGSRDALDSIELSQLFKCHVFTFECNPVAIDVCRRNIGSSPNITLVPMAVWNKSGPLSFYKVWEGEYWGHKNVGASSCFKFNPNAKNYADIVEEGLVQEEITVNAIRLDEFLEANQIDFIDLICMDVQGAAFQALEGLGQYLSKVKYIITELEVDPIYEGEVLYPAVDAFLTQRGFVRTSEALREPSRWGDVVYVNSNIIVEK